ncbi:hypothetical protein EMEDMD4_570182 [Sinorhizobium medicae]|uniref:Uncharacterized protein n=1 Tax=Sinorhizobium medicae TaxID=110321 RepID=A0A508X389_9HYPH|nr:hypothetical protein EMEDMD4_570182 [Sinorhizobium medicae]
MLRGKHALHALIFLVVRNVFRSGIVILDKAASLDPRRLQRRETRWRRVFPCGTKTRTRTAFLRRAARALWRSLSPFS